MEGSLIIDKAAGLTSHDVVVQVRRAAGIRRVGHAGTLDPFATGVLVVCVGRATRLARFVSTLAKEYVGTVRLGFATDTQDLTGKQIGSLQSSNELSPSDVARVLERFRGSQLQLPPMFSAKRIEGERLHRIARTGREVERDPAPITVHLIEMIDLDGREIVRNANGTCDFAIRVRCSSGTYVRTLAHDIGRELGVGGHLIALRRTAVGRFDLSKALPLDELEERGRNGTLEAALITPAETVGHLPALVVEPDGQRRIRAGMAIPVEREECIGEGEDFIRLCDVRGRLLAVAEIDRAAGVARPRVVLSAGEPGSVEG